MKNMFLLFFTLATILMLAACESDKERELKIMAPSGSPSLSQTYFQYTRPTIEGTDYTIDIVSGAEPLSAAFISESHDIIFAPTNLGANLIATGDVPYRFAATVTWGNLYLVSTSPINTLADVDGEEITLFGENATPDIITRSLLSEHDFDDEPSIRYVDSVQTALATLKTETEAIVLLAEPVLSMGQHDMEDLHVIDLQEAWREMTGKDAYPQAGIFVKDTLPADIVDVYLQHIETSVQMANEDPVLVAEYATALDYDFPKHILEEAIPRSNIAFKTALESREDLEEYFGRILDFNPDLIRGRLPDDDFYYPGD